MTRRYKIGELSSACDISVAAIRFYEQKGVIKPACRTLKNQRLFDEETLERLRFIRRCRRINMPLECICHILAGREDHTVPPEELAGRIGHYIQGVRSLRSDLDEVEKLLKEILHQVQTGS